MSGGEDRQLLPDERRYIRAWDEAVPRPFHLRWLLPWLLQGHHFRWMVVNRASILALGPLAWWFTGSPWAALLWWGLAAAAFNWRWYIMVDTPAMAVALTAVCLWGEGWYVPAVGLVLVAGMVKESAPVYAAAWAWHPALLVGLIPVAIRALTAKPGPEEDGPKAKFIHDHPFKASQVYHAETWLEPQVMFLPWGALVASLLVLDWQIGVVIALAYLPMLVATDSHRIYVWAWPVLAAATVAVVPPMWLPLVAVAHLFNPWRGDGV